MPGAIQVTVLEFKGVSSSSKPSAKSLKVSMGKRQYQTWDKGDFSFPITKIGEDLVVALLDSGGNEIAHQDIRTMEVIEKGFWDEVFSINGGGHVHMKLQFVLSDEDKNRIRIVRESVVKKKLEANPNIKLRLNEAVSSATGSVETKNEQKVSDFRKGFVEIDVMSLKVEASEAGSSLASASLHKEGGRNLDESAIPDATDGFESAPSSDKREIKTESSQVQESVSYESTEAQEPLAIIPFKQEIVSYDSTETRKPPVIVRSDNEEGTLSVSEKDNSVAFQKSKNEDPVKRTPSNVRKMISAFESSKMDFKKEVKSLKKESSVPSHLNRYRKGDLLEDKESTAVVPRADKSFGDFKDPVAETVSVKGGNASSDDESSSKELPAVKRVPPVVGNDHKKLEVSTVDVMRQSTSETATSSGRVAEEKQAQVTQPYEMSSKTFSSTESSIAEGSGRGTSLKSSTRMMASNTKPKTLECHKEECDSAQSSGMWVFPDHTRRLCITTAGKQVNKMVGHNEAKLKKISSESKNLMHEMELKVDKTQKKIVHQPKSGSGSSPDDSSNGLVGQVVKIAVIIGFGVLVLLTRQKEPRAKRREEKDNLFHIH